MPNQAPHTPQVSSIPEGNTISMKPPIISPEIYERFEQVKAMTFSEETIQNSNKVLKQAELKKQNEYIEINGIRLETENLGRPQNPDIKINPKEASETISQAWEHNGNWYYNFSGAQAEAKYLGKTIPTKEQWEEICKPFGQDGVRLSKELNMPMVGFYFRSNGLRKDQSTKGFYWSSSLFHNTIVYSLYFNPAIVDPVNLNDYAVGFSVRCIFPEKKEELKLRTEKEKRMRKQVLNDLSYSRLLKKRYLKNNK